MENIPYFSTVIIPLVLIIIHFIADFIFQAEEWAINKSKSNMMLFRHVFTYSSIWFLCIIAINLIVNQDEDLMVSIQKSIYFSLITFVCHFATDYVTSRIVSKRFADKHLGSPIPNFGAFTIIGLDQVFHYIQLFITFSLII